MLNSEMRRKQQQQSTIPQITRNKTDGINININRLHCWVVFGHVFPTLAPG